MLSQAEIDARLARWAVTADGRDLWPEVPVPAFRAAQAEIGRVAAAALSGTPDPEPLRLPSGVDAHALGVAANASGMGPLLGWWCENGRVTAEPPVAELLAQHLDHGRRRARTLRAGLERVIAALAGRGVEALVLKSCHTAYRYFPEPGTRPASDVDLLVGPADAPRAADALRHLGFSVVEASRVRERSTWRPPGAGPVRSIELTHADDPWTLDLHVSLDRTLLPGVAISLGAVAPAAGDVWYQFSRPVRVLPQPLLLAYLAAHASSHFFSMPLVRLVELALVARADFGGRTERWRGFGDLVRRTGTDRFMFPALDLAERLAPGTVDPIVHAGIAAATPARLRRRVRRLDPGTAQRLHPYPRGERFIWSGTPREVLAAALEVAWPEEQGRPMPPWRMLRRQWQRARRLLARLARRRGAS
jgi:hypothetical protein